MRYLIGIDLGTTNSCVAYFDTGGQSSGIQQFKIHQYNHDYNLEHLATLPSFCYLPSEQEISTGLPGYVVGEYAVWHGAKTPTRLVQSAKSWLCHPAASRRDKILPLDAADEAIRISPVEATTRYLRHIRDAWNVSFAKNNPEADFDLQEIVLTVPASFDEVARSLTVEAASKAGFKQMTLLEEPQAAFYSWIASHEEGWESILNEGDRILVCDVGGGTTDFTLIKVVKSKDKLAFERLAVGDHLLLGGDNMDGAIAYHIEEKLRESGNDVTNLQRSQLLHAARKAKERLLGSNEESYKVILQGTGSSVIKGTVTAELQKKEMINLIQNGFFGAYTWDKALEIKKSSGLRSMGLSYEAEPSIIKQLAHFLSKYVPQEEGRTVAPTHVLFNGGAMKPVLFQTAIIEALNLWFPQTKAVPLSSYNLDLAVARGAAYYGKVRRGMGVKIGGGMARGYYLILDDAVGNKKALCLLPKGSEEGDRYEPATTFLLQPNMPISFQLCTSHIRQHDHSEDKIEIIPEEMHFLPPIHTILSYGKGVQEKIPVHLLIHLTPLGTLELALKSTKTEHRWKLEFQVRAASGQDNTLSTVNTMQSEKTYESSLLKDVDMIINDTFGKTRTIKLEKLIEKIEEVTEQPKNDWSTSLLRHIFNALLLNSEGRKVSQLHETRWWNLIGYCLRPGFGYPLDDFRIKELWKVILTDYKKATNEEILIQHYIAYRRIAGGLNRGQQLQLTAELWKGKIEVKGKADLYQFSERIRALGAFELLDIPQKIKIGNALVQRIVSGEASSAEHWALGRIGARHLLYGSLANVVPAIDCERWVEKLLQISGNEEKLVPIFKQLARKTEHREINLSADCIASILKRYPLEEQLLHQSSLSPMEQSAAFGDQLPAGLQLM